MVFCYEHTNLNVTDLARSIAFYEEALSLSVVRRMKAEDGSFELVFLSDGQSGTTLELTWLADKEGPYNLGDNETHLAFRPSSFEEAKAMHQKMGVICYENTSMGLYLITDPDGYWIEILPPTIPK